MTKTINTLEKLTNNISAERWKETPLASILENKWQPVNKQSIQQKPDQIVLPGNAIVIPLINGFIDEQYFNADNLPVGILLKYQDQTLEIIIAENEKIPQAIVVQQVCVSPLSADNEYQLHCEIDIKITVEKNAQAHFLMLETGLGNMLYTPKISVSLEENARCEWLRAGLNSKDSYNLIDININQAQGSYLRTYNYQSGSKVARCDLNVCSQGENIQTYLYALNLAKDLQKLAYVVSISHEIANSISVQHIKNIAKDQAIITFDGHIQVRPDAQKIDAQQLTQSMLLSDDARVLTVPRLEIYADDVQCSHGATIGALEAEGLFYLRSRGLDELEAKHILLKAFAASLILEIEHVSLQEWYLEIFNEDLQAMLI